MEGGVGTPAGGRAAGAGADSGICGAGKSVEDLGTAQEGISNQSRPDLKNGRRGL